MLNAEDIKQSGKEKKKNIKQIVLFIFCVTRIKNIFILNLFLIFCLKTLKLVHFGNWKLTWISERYINSKIHFQIQIKFKNSFLGNEHKLTSFILAYAWCFALAATARTSVSKMNWTKAFRLDQNISCVLLKEDIIFQAKSNASMQRDSAESRSWKQRE